MGLSPVASPPEKRKGRSGQANRIRSNRPTVTDRSRNRYLVRRRERNRFRSPSLPDLAMRGTKPVLPVLAEHWRTSIVGAVRPSDGYFCALSISGGNQWTFQVFLDELNRQIDPAKRNIVILDNARFPSRKFLAWGRLEPLFLPPYSPELNPIEELWLQLKKNFFYYWLPTDQENLENKVDGSTQLLHGSSNDRQINYCHHRLFMRDTIETTFLCNLDLNFLSNGHKKRTPFLIPPRLRGG